MARKGCKGQSGHRTCAFVDPWVYRPYLSWNMQSLSSLEGHPFKYHRYTMADHTCSILGIRPSYRTLAKLFLIIQLWPVFHCLVFKPLLLVKHIQHHLTYMTYFEKNYDGLTLKALHKSHPLEIVCRYHDPQVQACENNSYMYLFNLKQNICKSWFLKNHFIPNIGDFID